MLGRPAITKRFYQIKTQLFLLTRWNMILWIISPQEWTWNNVNLQFNHKLTFTVKWLAYMENQTQSSSKLLIPQKDSRTSIQIQFRAQWKPYFLHLMEPVERPQVQKVWKVMMSTLWERALQSNKILLRLNPVFLEIFKYMNNLEANKYKRKINSSLRILRNPTTSFAKST